MPIQLTHFERGQPFPGDASAALAAFQQRLAGSAPHRSRMVEA
jgi:hypothetical protein